MKCKKLIAMGLAVIATLSLAAPAFAENTVITGTYNEIKIDVDIPTTGTAVINPYGMPVKAMYQPKKADGSNDGDAVEVGTLTTAGKVATQPLVGISTCEVALDVGATVIGTAKGNLSLSSAALTDADTKNAAVVYLECKTDTTLSNSSLSDGTTASDQAISGVKGADAVAAFNAWPASTYNFGTGDAAVAANSDKILVTTKEATKAGLCTIAAGVKNASSGKMEPQTGSFFLARLGGDVVQNPKTAWSAKDTLTVNVAFTFVPAAAKDGGAIAIDDLDLKDTPNPKLTVADPEGVTLDASATYEWVIVDAGDTGATSIDTSDDNKILGDLEPGDITVKCTITDVTGIKYVSTKTFTLVDTTP